MWFARETVDLSEMKTESSGPSRLDRWSANFAKSQVRSDRAKLSLVLVKESARASDLSLASKRKTEPNQALLTTPMLTPFLFFSSRQYGASDL